MNRLILACLALIVSGQIFAGVPIRVHWPLMEYVSLVKAEAKDLIEHNGSQTGLSFPTLIVFSESGQLVWIGKPAELTPDVVSSVVDSDGPATIDSLGRVLKALDSARKVYPDVGFEQVAGAPSDHVQRSQPTAILVVGSFSCEGCALTIETSMQGIPDAWNQLAAAVTLSP